MDTIKTLLNRLLFVLLSAAIIVFFSEKSFWYVQGYAIGELILFYALPLSICLWLLDHFQVHTVSGLVLVGGLLAVLLEGILTPVLYEEGLLDPVLPALLIGWHGLISFVFGWYLIRKWLIENKQKYLCLGGALFGIFWGVWSLPYRLPEMVLEFEGYNLIGETFFPGAWPVEEYLYYTVVFTAMLMFSHWLLGRGLWQERFELKLWEGLIPIMILTFFFIVNIFPNNPLAILKLVFFILLVIIPLRLKRNEIGHAGVLTSQGGMIRFSQTFPLLLIPIFASLIYALAGILPPSHECLRTIAELIPISLTALGGGAFIWSWVNSFRKAGSNTSVLIE